MHPAVAEAAVVGIPDDFFGEEICAVLQLRPGASPSSEEIREHAARFLGKFKLPAHVIFMAALPRTSSGKVHKQTLRQQLTQKRVA